MRMKKWSFETWYCWNANQLISSVRKYRINLIRWLMRWALELFRHCFVKAPVFSFLCLADGGERKKKENPHKNSFHDKQEIALQLINCKHTRIAPRAPLSISGFRTMETSFRGIIGEASITNGRIIIKFLWECSVKTQSSLNVSNVHNSRFGVFFWLCLYTAFERQPNESQPNWPVLFNISNALVAV